MRRSILPHTVRHHPSKPKGQACCTTWTAVFGVLIFISVALLLFVLQSDVRISSDPSKSIHLQEFVTSLHIPETVKSLESRVYELEASMLQGNSHAPISTDSLQEANQLPNAETPQTKPRKKFAYAITITKDGSFQDGAAVLAYSIMKHSHQADYDISFIAFVHPNVTTSREPLRRLGYHVIEVPVPINASAIKFDFLREKINKNGCCGAAELIKLTSYRLLQYDRVIHLDADVVLLNPIDPLFDLPYSLVYTTDPNMATFKKGIDKMPVQGGFIIVQPSIADYRGIIQAEMTTEFRKYRGWNASHIGWYWGGMTVQGILPYYYHRLSAPNRSLIVDRCVYNSMADTPDCLRPSILDLRSAHFTVCQKPWGCWMRMRDNPLCHDLHQTWFQYRQEAEIFYGLLTSQTLPEDYTTVFRKNLMSHSSGSDKKTEGLIAGTSPEDLAAGANGNRSINDIKSRISLVTTASQQRVCRRGGQGGYQPMALLRAQWPGQAVATKENPFAHYARNVVRDASADRFDPVLPESQYASLHGPFD